MALLFTGLLGIGILILQLPRVGLGPSRARSTDPTMAVAVKARSVPFSVRPVIGGLLPVRPEDRQRLQQLIQPFRRDASSVSLCLHVLRVHGLDGRFSGGNLPSGRSILELLTDRKAGQAYFGEPVLFRTRGGARYPTGSSTSTMKWEETHRDQVLAALAELGIPLSQPLKLDDDMLTLRDVLRDSMGSFHLHQDELVWTALAYGLYLPPQHSWCNRFGDRTSFDDLVAELIHRPLDKASCAGTHLVYTLIILARVDQQEPFLTRSAREGLWQHLQRVLRLVVAKQRPEGSWSGDWYQELLEGPADPGRPSNTSNWTYQLVTTSHMAELLLYLPAELQVPKQCLERSGSWLYEQLRAASPESVRDNFCPFSHAACVVGQLAIGSHEGSSRFYAHRE